MPLTSTWHRSCAVPPCRHFISSAGNPRLPFELASTGKAELPEVPKTRSGASDADDSHDIYDGAVAAGLDATEREDPELMALRARRIALDTRISRLSALSSEDVSSFVTMRTDAIRHKEQLEELKVLLVHRHRSCRYAADVLPEERT